MNTKLLMCLFGLFLMVSCGDDEPDTPPTGDSPISSFQFEVDANDFLTVNFQNFSDNATSYSWDFGDGENSTLEAPSHTYAGGGEYDVVLTAINAFDSRTSTKTVTITDPNEAARDLTGESSKVWKLSRNVADEEYPLLVGPETKTEIWWAFGLNDPIGSRPCLMEEEYIFDIDGGFTYNTNGEVFADFGTWNADVEGQCIDDTDASLMVGPGGEDLLPWGAGTFTYDFDPQAMTLTLNGLGAHVGLPKAATSSEVTVPQPSVTYRITSLETDGPVDKLVLETSIPGGYWQFSLVSYDDPTTEPELPGAAPTTSFSHTVDGNTVMFENSSVNADSYLWDFGDSNMSTDISPTHTYASDGSYDVVLTATNANGSSTSMVNIVISNNSVFSASTITGDDMKSWRLNPGAGALSVGPFKGSGEWFSTTEEDVMDRACTFDDTYTFGVDGKFVYATNGDLWGEPYMGIDPDGCVDDVALPAETAAWGPGEHAFVVEEGEVNFVTVTGTGAFIGLPKAFNGGEYAAGPPTENGSVRYEVLDYIDDGEKEIMRLTVDISEGSMGGAYWTFTLISE